MGVFNICAGFWDIWTNNKNTPPPAMEGLGWKIKIYLRVTGDLKHTNNQDNNKYFNPLSLGGKGNF